MKKILTIIIILGIGITAPVIANESTDIVYEINMLYLKEDYKTALQKVDTAIAQNGNDAELYILRGQIMDKLNSPKSALTNFKKAIELDPKSSDAYQWSAMVKQDIGDTQGAYIDACKCIQLKPKNAGCYAVRGMVRLEMSDMQGFQEDMEKSQNLMHEEMKIMDEYN